MPLSTALVGKEIGEVSTPITLRRVMAYAAGVGDHNMRYFDDTRPEPVAAQPVFGVALDFPLHVPLSAMLGLNDDELLHQVHATQDMRFHRLIRVGDVLTTRGIIAGAEQRAPGAYLVMRFDTTATDGTPVLTTYFGLLFRGVPCDGPTAWADRPSELPAATKSEPDGRTTAVPIPWGLPHVYTECAQLYLGIHTERSTAKAMGLPDIILHGTATLAIAAREIVDQVCGGDPSALARVSVRFAGMVVPDSTITVRLDEQGRAAEGRLVRFTVSNAAGQPAIKDGVAVLRG